MRTLWVNIKPLPLLSGYLLFRAIHLQSLNGGTARRRQADYKENTSTCGEVVIPVVSSRMKQCHTLFRLRINRELTLGFKGVARAAGNSQIIKLIAATG